MFQEIIESVAKTEELQKETIHNLRLVNSYLGSITTATKDKLRAIKKKYNFDNRQNIIPNPANDTHLEFIKGLGEYNILVFLADKTGVYDNDKELGVIIREWPYANFLTIDNDIELGKYYKIVDNIFYTWLSFLWQTVEGHETKLSVKIIENNSSSIFCLNDFAWYDLSKFIDYIEPVKPKDRFFNRDLGLAEIYSRVDIRFSFLEVPERTRAFQRNEELKEVVLKQGFTFVDNVQLGQGAFESVNDFLKIKHRQIMYVDVINDLLKDDWTDVTFQGT
ncbi:hypothetical protein WBG78_23165 [Chryseolinea sp. T2]|uniref:hypothetical protein n=1 Tax=Chryseolinea sp. T2 TaxID=3129255 RepID=UPI003077D8F0